METASLEKKEVNFYAIHATESKNFVMEMMIGHKPGGSDNDIKYFKFTEIKPHTLIPGYEALKLFHLKLDLYTFKKNDKVFKKIQTETGLKEVWDYQIRVTNGNIVTRGNFYEEYGKFRKILEKKNNFIFDLHIIANEQHWIFKESKSESICLYLEQTLCYLLLGIETKKFGNLNSFVGQYEENLKKDQKPDQRQIQKYYKTIQAYIERKGWLAFEKDFEALVLFTCLFGLLPDAETIIIEIDSLRLFQMIKNYEMHAEKLLELRNKEPTLFRIMVRGIAIFFVLEECGKSCSFWIDLLKKLKTHRTLIDDIVPTFLRFASLAKIEIKQHNFEHLRKIQDNLLVFYPKGLVFASSLIDFASMMKKDIILPKLPKLQCNEPKQASSQEEGKLSEESKKETVENTIDLPNELSEDEGKIIQDLKETLELCLEEYLKKRKDTGRNVTLPEYSDFLEEINGTSVYFQIIFSNSDTLSDMLNQTLEEATFYTPKNLNYLCTILVEYKNSILLWKLNIAEYLQKKLSKNQVSKTVPVYYTFFQMFLTMRELSLQEFKDITTKWFESVENVDKFLEELDRIYNSFSDEDEEVQMKKEFLTQKVITLLKNTSFANKMETVIKSVKNNQALQAYEKLVEQEILSKIEHLQIKNYANPLFKLQDIAKRYPENALIQRLISFCITLVPSLNKEDILLSLFEKVDGNSILYTVLTEKVYKETTAFANINQICCKILEDMMDSNLEMSWILRTEKLVGHEKNYSMSSSTSSLKKTTLYLKME